MHLQREMLKPEAVEEVTVRVELIRTNLLREGFMKSSLSTLGSVFSGFQNDRFWSFERTGSHFKCSSMNIYYPSPHQIQPNGLFPQPKALIPNEKTTFPSIGTDLTDDDVQFIFILMDLLLFALVEWVKWESKSAPILDVFLWIIRWNFWDEIN